MAHPSVREGAREGAAASFNISTKFFLNQKRVLLPHWLLTTFLILYSVFYPSNGYSQNTQLSERDTQADKPPSYKNLIGTAEKCFKESDFECCALRFQEAYPMKPQPAILYNIGLCSQEAKQCPEAIEFFSNVINSTEDKNIIKAAEKERAACHELIGELKLTVSPADADIYIDGTRVERDVSGVSLFLYSGSHKIKVTHGDYFRYDDEIVLTAGSIVSLNPIQLEKKRGKLEVSCKDNPYDMTIYVDYEKVGFCPPNGTFEGEFDLRTLNIRIEGPEGNTVCQAYVPIYPNITTPIKCQPPPPRPADPTPPDLPPPWQKIVGIVSLAVGGASLVAMGVADGVKTKPFRDAYHAAEDARKNGEDTSEYDEARQKAEAEWPAYDDWTNHPARIAGYSIGGTLMVGGGVLLLLHQIRKKAPKERENASIQPVPGGFRIRF
jgi:hypothetical protein